MSLSTSTFHSLSFKDSFKWERYDEVMFTSSSPLTGGTLSGRFMRHTLVSKHLGGERAVTVRLPDSYSPEKQYPVVYLKDGQNMFDRRTSFGGKEWGVDETFSSLSAQGRVPEAILVAVDNGGVRRLEEYTHVQDPKHGGGQGEKYEEFFMGELLPAVESTYSVDAKKRVLMGSSLGGLVSLAIGLNHPTAFAAIGALSSSVWWADGDMATQTLAAPPPTGPKPKIWLDMGTEEGNADNFGKRSIQGDRFSQRPEGGNGVQDARDSTREMGEALLKKGWELDKTLRYHEPLGARHNEESWAGRVGEVAEWLMK